MNRVVISERRPRRSLLLCLPDGPSSQDMVVRWWLVEGGLFASHGEGDDWLAIGAEPGTSVIGLVPPSLARIAFARPGADTPNPKQAETVARVEATEASLGELETLHAASASLDRDPPLVVTAVVANDRMVDWLDWAERAGVPLDHVVPMAMLLPLCDEWVRLAVGSTGLVGREGLVMADEPGLADALLDGEPIVMDEAGLGSAIVGIASDPRPDLRTGRFAKRRVLFDRSRLRSIGLLLVALAAVTTLIAVVQIVRLHQAARALDADTLAVAQSIAGPSVTIDNAEAAVAAKVGGAAGMSPTVGAILQRLREDPNLTVTALGYGRGTTTLTLSAPSADAINRLLQALQRDGYRLTATPRTGTGGQSLADVTIEGQ